MLARSYAQATLVNVWNIWNNGGVEGRRPVALVTKNKNGEDMVYVCEGPRDEHSSIMSRKLFEDNYAALAQTPKTNL